jgi:hypothetical protein
MLEVLEGDVAEPDGSAQAFIVGGGHRGEPIFEEPIGVAGPHDPQVYDGK